MFKTSEAQLKANRKYRANHKEEIREYQNRYREQNLDKYREANRRYRERKRAQAAELLKETEEKNKIIEDLQSRINELSII